MYAGKVDTFQNSFKANDISNLNSLNTWVTVVLTKCLADLAVLAKSLADLANYVSAT